MDVFFERRSGYLVQQGPEAVIIVAVKDQHVHVLVAQFLAGVDPAKARSNYDHAGTAGARDMLSSAGASAVALFVILCVSVCCLVSVFSIDCVHFLPP